MFYSNDILTSRKYGVATIWIVATLGSKTTVSKKVNKRAILDVDVPKAVETIITPEAPMALRLQSNLLYGVARVYDQQCGFVLSDAHHIQVKMREMLKSVRNAALDLEAGRAARPEQLLLPDDPDFMPDLLLTRAALDLEMDLTEPDLISDHGSSQSSSLLSPHTIRAQSPSIIVPTSDGQELMGGLGQFDFGDDEQSRAGRLSSLVPGSAPRLNSDTGFDPNPDFMFDIDGGILTGHGPGSAIKADTAAAARNSRAGSEISAVERVRQDQEDANRARAQQQEDDEGFVLPQMDDNDGILPDAQPFSPRTRPAPDGGNINEATPTSAHEAQQSEESAVAPARRVRTLKLLTADTQVELRNIDLRGWERDYITNMARAADVRNATRAAKIAKQNAEFWVWQMGIAGIGGNGGTTVAPGLEMFYGDRFIHAVLGIQGQKRDRACAEVESEEEGRRTRQRTLSPRAEEVGRGNMDALMDDDGMGLNLGDDDIEIGRNAPTPLPADPTIDPSSAMPWNLSASQRSSILHRNTLHRLSRTGSASSAALPTYNDARRLTSASPLVGRGTHLALTLPDRLSRANSLVPGGGAATSSVNGADFGLGGFATDNDTDMRDVDVDGENDPNALTTQQQAEFEAFGPAAGIDTQTAASSQWIKGILDVEGRNFLEFVEVEVARRVAAADAGDADGEGDDAADGGNMRDRGKVTFEMLLPAEVNTAVVAAQGLLHCLALATKGLLEVQQREEFGEIWLRPIGGGREGGQGVGGGGKHEEGDAGVVVVA